MGGVMVRMESLGRKNICQLRSPSEFLTLTKLRSPKFQQELATPLPWTQRATFTQWEIILRTNVLYRVVVPTPQR